MRTKHTFRLPPDLALKLADYAYRKGVPQALVVETALASFLSPDSSERLEGALGRRLDRLVRQVERLLAGVVLDDDPAPVRAAACEAEGTHGARAVHGSLADGCHDLAALDFHRLCHRDVQAGNVARHGRRLSRGRGSRGARPPRRGPWAR